MFIGSSFFFANYQVSWQIRHLRGTFWPSRREDFKGKSNPDSDDTEIISDKDNDIRPKFE